MSARRAAMRRVQRSRLCLWYVYDTEAAYEEEANGQMIVASCRSQAAAIWRRHYGLSACDLGEDQLSVEPAVWEWAEPEPKHPKRPGIWWPKGELFRGYGLHLVDDDTCENCGEYVTATDEEGLCPDCAEQEEAEAGSAKQTWPQPEDCGREWLADDPTEAP